MRYGWIVAAVLSALLCRTFLVSVYKVPSQNMAPTILSGDFLLASKVSYGLKFPWARTAIWQRVPQRGELVVYIGQGKTMIKRVVALPGEKIRTLGAALTVNGVRCSILLSRPVSNKTVEFAENCADQEVRYPVLLTDGALPEKVLANIDEIELAESQYLLANDNRSESATTPLFDLAEYDQIIGSPFLIWMSYSSTQDFISDGRGFHWNRILTKPR